METGSDPDASDCGGVAVGNKANGVMGVGGIFAVWDACGAVAEDTTSIAILNHFLYLEQS